MKRRRSDPTSRVLGLIPARGGSKGIPRKNIAPLAGKPLLAYTAAAALAATRLTRVIVSTDDGAIAEVARSCGVDVPFMRPASLATDAASSLAVVQHAVRWLEEQGEKYNAICLLQPTSPLREADEIDACVALLAAGDCTAVMTVRPIPDEFNPHWAYEYDAGGYLRVSTGEENPISRRQDLPDAYYRDGSVIVTRRDTVMEQNSLYGAHVAGYRVESEPWVDIDTPADLQRAETLLVRRVTHSS
jgi:CMP-N,N'-diacetyllegionaminic acid synthase